jgi:predicted glycosyltransferase
MTGSILFYVQHLLGIGHLQRALSLVDAIVLEDIAVTLVLGGEPPPWPISVQAERLVQLPPISARDASFKELVGPDGQVIDQKMKKSRRDALLAAFDAARPDAVVIEAFPFGRRAFRFELEPLLEAARARRPRPRILCSLRDIVVVPDEATRQREIIDRVRADFDLVLVHGDPDFIPLDESFPAASEIADCLVYTGYISAAVPPDAKDEKDVAGVSPV